MKKTEKKRFLKTLSVTLAVSIFVGCAGMVKVGAAETAQTDVITIEDEQAIARALPEGAQRTGVNINGRRVLEGRVFVYEGITYVPMFKFADWLGVFKYSTSVGSITTGRIEGENLVITASEDNLYINANGRYFYTVGKVMEIDGELYVPITPLVKALNSHLSLQSGTYYVRSGDTRLLKSAEEFYREDAVYWLSRIISAEARGESLRGKMAVGNVVLNRVRAGQFPSTIYGVIFDKKYGVQFAPTENGTIYNMPTQESIIAAKMCLEGYSITNTALYFFNPKYTSGSWVRENRIYAFTLGNHVFYN